MPCNVAGLTARCFAAAIHAHTNSSVSVPTPGNSLRLNASNRASSYASAWYL